MPGCGPGHPAARRPLSLRVLAALSLASVLMGAGCSEPSPGVGHNVSDSAGVTIVESSAPAWGEGEGWRVGPEPWLVIGGDDPAQALYQVVGVDRLSTGEIVVGDGGSQEIRVYSLDGTLVEVFGGQGEGPGEFTTLSAVHVLAGDTILSLNQVPLRVSRFLPQEGHLGDLLLGHDREPPWVDPQPIGLLGNSRLVVWGLTEYLEFGSGIHHPPLPWGVLDLSDGRVTDGGVFPGAQVALERRERGIQVTGMPFSRTGDAAAAGEAVLVTPNDLFRVLRYRLDGSLEADWRYRVPPRPVPASAVSDWVDWRVGGAGARSDPRVDEAARRLEALPAPDRFPPVAGLEVDALGHTWVREFQWPPEGPVSFVVFDPEGRVLGRVAVPPGLDGANGPTSKPALIGRDFLLGVWRNALDVEEVRLYPLVRGEG
jgi:hypothetical protein